MLDSGRARVALQEIPLENLVLLGSPLLAEQRGRTSCCHPKRGDLETLASRLALMPAHDSLFLLRNVVTTPRLHVRTLRGRRHARAARSSSCTTRCCGQLCPQPSTWTCRMRDGSKLHCQYDGGDWGFVVLLSAGTFCLLGISR